MKYFYLILLISLSLCNLQAANPDSLCLVQHYDKAEYEMPMRDGVKLFTIVRSALRKHPGK